MKSRNPIARNTWKFNKPKVYKAKKGKGSFNRQDRKDIAAELGFSRISCNSIKY
jgi:stalled ribosome alternative rescue factor ArfA